MTTLRQIWHVVLRGMNISTLLRRTVFRRDVGIVLYHSICPELFEAHLTILKKNYHVISLDTLVDAIESDNWAKLPDNALVITFDDGMKDFYQLRDVLRRYRVPVTHFIVSGALGTNRHLWFTEVVSSQVIERLKGEPHQKRLSYLADHCKFSIDREYDARQVLSIDETTELMKLGTTIGSHTVSHPILPTCEDVVAEREIVASKHELEAKMGVRVDHFGYPNGAYSIRDEELVRRAGYRSARTVERGLNDRHTSPFQLKIADVLEDRSAADVEQIELRLLWYRIRELLRISNHNNRCLLKSRSRS